MFYLLCFIYYVLFIKIIIHRTNTKNLQLKRLPIHPAGCRVTPKLMLHCPVAQPWQFFARGIDRCYSACQHNCPQTEINVLVLFSLQCLVLTIPNFLPMNVPK